MRTIRRIRLPAVVFLVVACRTGSTSSAPPVIPPANGAPHVLYTDVLSGPTTGGEDGKGAYLSVFGMNFGTTGLGTTLRVYVGDVEVDNYRYLGLPKGRVDLQQVTVQVGALGNPAQGTALPIKVVVNGVASNTDHTFTPNPGRMLFVDNVKGDDATAVAGDLAHPFRHVGATSAGTSAFGVAQPERLPPEGWKSGDRRRVGRGLDPGDHRLRRADRAAAGRRVRHRSLRVRALNRRSIPGEGLYCP